MYSNCAKVSQVPQGPLCYCSTIEKQTFFSFSRKSEDKDRSTKYSYVPITICIAAALVILIVIAILVYKRLLKRKGNYIM